ncbi:MAG: ATP-binding protein [Pacificimonas sp.]|jgi:predicted kinase|nr:ATP-binding protein [Pacificimonas sp.]
MSGDAAPTVHLIVGNVGAGKSTYARALAAQKRAHVFANDPWFAELYQPDLQGSDYAWTLERTQRIERVMIAEAKALLALGLDVIFDIGFFERSQRDRVRGAFDAGVVVTHFLDVDADERWRRVEERNAEKGETYSMTVDRQMFDFCETIFEAPKGAEYEAAVLSGGEGVSR